MIMQQVILGKKMTIKLLETNEIFTEGILNNFYYNGGFSSVEEEIDFFTRIIEIETYFNKVISIPNEVYEGDWDAVFYISNLLRGQTCSGEWKRFSFTFNICEERKESLVNIEDKDFSLSYVGIATIPLWEENYELLIARTFESGKFENLENLKKKIKVLDKDDSIKVVYVATGLIGKFSDVLNKNDVSLSN